MQNKGKLTIMKYFHACVGSFLVKQNNFQMRTVNLRPASCPQVDEIKAHGNWFDLQVIEYGSDILNCSCPLVLSMYVRVFTIADFYISIDCNVDYKFLSFGIMDSIVEMVTV